MCSHREQDIIYKLILFKLKHKPYAFDEMMILAQLERNVLFFSLNPMIVIHLMISRTRMLRIKIL